MDKVSSLAEAESWFLSNSEGSVICTNGTTEKVVNCYPDAKKFFEE